MEDCVTINFKGVELILPPEVPFTYTPKGTLALDFSAGFSGKLHLRAANQLKTREVSDLAKHGCGNRSEPTRTRSHRHDESLGRLDAALDRLETVIPESQAGQSAGIMSWFNQSPLHSQMTPEEDQGQQATVASQSEGKAACENSPSPEQRHQKNKAQDANPTSSDLPTAEAEDSRKSEANLEETPAAGLLIIEKLPDKGAEKLSSTIGEVHDSEEQADHNKLPYQEKGGKENLPAAAYTAKKVGKRKSDGRGSAPSIGRRSGKKSKAASSFEASGMTFQWKSLACAADDGLPQERWGATLTGAEMNQAWLFAGNSAEDQLADLWSLDVVAQKWRKLSENPDQVKAWHQAELIPTDQGKHMYAFGGERVKANAVGGDEDEDLECLSEICQYDEAAKMWLQLPITGVELRRSGHTTTLLPDGRVFVFGGIDNDGRHRNDAHLIDLQHLNCFSLSGGITRGAPPKPRAYHSATLVGSSVIVLGGIGARVWSMKEVYSLSTETWHWKEHTADVEGDAPSPRSGHSAVALPGDRYLLVFGGGIPDQDTFFGTVSILDTHTWAWSIPNIQGVNRPRGRSGHGMAVIELEDGQHAITLHGGRTHEERLCKDTWILERIS